ncbi:MAG: glutamine synthetase, partial [Thermoanaerobaculia bacterium]
LVRVPLGWVGVDHMIKEVNPGEVVKEGKPFFHQTVEFRCPDGSADIYLLLAGLAVAARHGLEKKDSLELAKKLYVDKNIFSPEYKETLKKIPKLPSSCWESAQNLLKQREIYQEYGVFPEVVIDGISKKLKSYNDKDLNKKLQNKGEEVRKIVEEYLYC